ncbi:MAG TPA: ABC transporter ATP-binding protein [Chloroflexota bacterium]|nr:ABC transporter ATP-binding protein [Chloroflexota bacterium]
MTHQSDMAVAMVGIDKRFPGVIANMNVDFSARWGEVHALLGENGAGKTTLMSILAGLYRPDAGHIRVDGAPVTFHAPRDAIRHGVGMVYQHYRLVASQTVAENLLLGLEGVPFRLNAGRFIHQARELGERYHLHIDPSRAVWQLSVGEQQRVEILKTLQRGATILILDEPTAVLTPQESEDLMRTLRQVAAEGRTVVLISHKLEEIRSVADRVTVLRGGAVVAGGLASGALSTRDLARMMVGEDLVTSQASGGRAPVGTEQPRLTLADISALNARALPALRRVNLHVRVGEILGIAGVAGNGQRELAQVVAGLRLPTQGKVWLDGTDVTDSDARSRMRLGVAHIPEDRLGEGLIGNLPLNDNAVLKSYDQPPLALGPLLLLQRVVRFTRSLLERFNIRGARPESITRLLSGGQLQRFLLAREMALNPRLIVAVHPTRGLDVAATQQVQAWLVDARGRGASVLLISEDLDEVLQLSDRIAVIYEGEIVGSMPAGGANREQIGLMMAGAGA